MKGSVIPRGDGSGRLQRVVVITEASGREVVIRWRHFPVSSIRWVCPIHGKQVTVSCDHTGLAAELLAEDMLGIEWEDDEDDTPETRGAGSTR